MGKGLEKIYGTVGKINALKELRLASEKFGKIHILKGILTASEKVERKNVLAETGKKVGMRAAMLGTGNGDE